MGELLQDGLRTPLRATQIAGIFEASCVGDRTRPKPTELNEGRTIEELFPLLKQGTSRQFVRRYPDPGRSQCHLSVPAAIALIFLSSIATPVMGQFFFGMRPSSVHSIRPSAATSAAPTTPLVAGSQSRNNSKTKR